MARQRATRFAHTAVSQAIREGVLVKQPCSRCAAPRAVAHHEDYDKPLDVIWLCGKCHSLRHRERGDFKPRIKRQPITLTISPALLERVDEVVRRKEISRAALLTLWIGDGLAKEAA